MVHLISPATCKAASDIGLEFIGRSALSGLDGSGEVNGSHRTGWVFC